MSSTELEPPQAPFALDIHSPRRMSLGSFRSNAPSAHSNTSVVTSLTGAKKKRGGFLSRVLPRSKLAEGSTPNEASDSVTLTNNGFEHGHADDTLSNQHNPSRIEEHQETPDGSSSRSLPRLRTRRSAGDLLRRFTTKLRSNTAPSFKFSPSSTSDMASSSPQPPVKSSTIPSPRISSDSGYGPNTHSLLHPQPQQQPRKRNSFMAILPSLPQSRPANVNSAFVSKEARNAALRAAGLVPHLSLSEQEARMDAFIPPSPVSPTPPSPRATTATTTQSQLGDSESANSPSAADRIKEEWASKNRQNDMQDDERWQNFKFGGGSSSIASPPLSPVVVTASPKTSSTTLLPSGTSTPIRVPSRRSSFVDLSIPPPTPPPRSPLPSPPSTPTPVDPDLTQGTPCPSPSRTKHVPPPLLLHSRSSERLHSREADVASMTSSPSHESPMLRPPRSPWLDIPLPPSPSLAPPATSSTGNVKPPSLVSPPAKDTSTTPPSNAAHFLQPDPPLASRDRSDSLGSFGSAPPSLSSSLPSLSTLASAETLIDTQGQQRQRHRSRSRTRGGEQIPVIAEDPVDEDHQWMEIRGEEGPHDFEIKHTGAEKKPTTIHVAHPPALLAERLSPMPEDEEEMAPTESISSSLGHTPLGGDTSPAAASALPASSVASKPSRRKSFFNAFRRVPASPEESDEVKTIQVSPSSLAPPQQLPRERRNSMSNLRRAFTSLNNHDGSKGRPVPVKASTISTPASPPLSPLSKSFFPEKTDSSGLTVEGAEAPKQATRRVSVFEKSPGVTPIVMHNRASILLEVDKIEDLESQRLTESAFLG